jgi:carbon-monoxide dehydrogenase medium subunit
VLDGDGRNFDEIAPSGREVTAAEPPRQKRGECTAADGCLETSVPRKRAIAHADPASEWCLLAATLDAELLIVSRRGQRKVRAREYFVGALTTTLKPDELLTEIRIPMLDEGWQTGFVEFSRQAGDFALAMCAAFLQFKDGRIAKARLGIGGATDRPSRIATAEAVLTGSDGDPEIRREAGDIAAAAIDPLEDIHASAAFRRDLVRAMVRRALDQALTR